MGRNIITGIDVGSSVVRVVVAERRKGSSPYILSAVSKPSGGIRKGYITDIDLACESIRLAVAAAERSAGVEIKNTYLAIGGISLGSIKAKSLTTVSRADTEISGLDVKRLFDQCESELTNVSNKDILHKIPLSYKVDGNQVLGRPIGMKGAKLEMEVLFITALSQHVDDLIKAVENIGIAVEDVVAAPYAASFAALTTQQKEVGCILANIGSTTVSIIAFEEGAPISLEVFPIGSTHITNDIALGLQIPIEEAEKVKINYGTEAPSKKKLADIIEARLNDIFDLIEAHLKKISRNGLLPAGIILVGGGSNLISLDEIAKSSLKLPARICKSFEQNFSRTQGPNSKDHILTDPAWSIPLGLILASDQISELGTSTIAGSNFLGKTKVAISKLLRNFLP